jgi:hypothetical protein
MRSAGDLKGFSMGRHYILTQPAKISDIIRGDLPYDNDDQWQERARRLQVRRWRKIKHQIEG